ncbi:unnamed protein product [Triticum turgidum subsp. durum]|uniref:Xylanase inhibitor C-terminal domain-containing protein n=1 Tax=Triticum turgidum subsp. durum TaxID=4567 RepID=A0A9R1RVZ7_TRITD|nr:unnamed protein product [Triticum turgidum subsp. durum]
MGSSAKVAAVAPFELCYDSSKLSPTLSGYSVPQVDVMLEGGTNWTVVGGNSMAQMENKLVVLDNDKKTLSFTPYLPARGFSCSNFNFTGAG